MEVPIILIPNKDGQYEYDGQKVIQYYAFVDTFHRIIEAYTTEDGTQWIGENEWQDLNDIEKYVCKQRGWNLDRFFEEEQD